MVATVWQTVVERIMAIFAAVAAIGDAHAQLITGTELVRINRC